MLQPFSEELGDSGETIQHIFPQVKGVTQDEYLSLSEATAAFDPGVYDSQVGKYPTFVSTVPSLPITNLDEHRSARSKITPPSMNPLIVPSENQILLAESHFFNPKATLTHPMLRDVTPEREAVELSMSLSLLPLNSKQISTSHSANSRPPSKSQILDGSHGQGLSTSEFENRGLALETFSPTGLDIIFEGQAQINSTYLATPSLLPDFNKLCPQRSKLSPFTAYMHIAILLGITLQDLTNGKHSSPFYRATTAEDDPQALLAAAAIPSLPAHLQPTLPQILFPHNSNLDLLPFPVLRARAITLAATTPQLVNPKELKMDILRDGLICWHSRSDNNNGIGQPWDIYSWEAASWFKKKWLRFRRGNGSRPIMNKHACLFENQPVLGTMVNVEEELITMIG
ncbi:quinate permease [Trichoderma arundinaceum]|uniref:Quinate permease n=1 Tax=Trichoderma arundinaceum TaxID=490622 RepID=A0A395NA03_TRIAR|nr:quinate permease [Trichoderma arundinaceum]